MPGRDAEASRPGRGAVAGLEGRRDPGVDRGPERRHLGERRAEPRRVPRRPRRQARPPRLAASIAPGPPPVATTCVAAEQRGRAAPRRRTRPSPRSRSVSRPSPRPGAGRSGPGRRARRRSAWSCRASASASSRPVGVLGPGVGAGVEGVARRRGVVQLVGGVEPAAVDVDRRARRSPAAPARPRRRPGPPRPGANVHPRNVAPGRPRSSAQPLVRPVRSSPRTRHPGSDRGRRPPAAGRGRARDSTSTIRPRVRSHTVNLPRTIRTRARSGRRTGRARRRLQTLWTGTTRRRWRSRASGSPCPAGLPTRSTICGRSMITSRSPAARMLYADRSPCTSPCLHHRGQRLAQLVEVRRRAGPASGRVWASRGARLAVDGDPLHEDLGAVDLHRVGDGQAERPAALERVPLRDRPLAGGDHAAEGALALDRALVAGALHRRGPRCRRRSGGRCGGRCCGSAWRPSRRRLSGSSGSPRSSRKTSASLPVLRMPSSVSIAPCEVTTQSGRGSGPRHSGSTSCQVDQRWPSSRSS